VYFGDFAGMMKPDEGRAAAGQVFDMDRRNRRTPRGPVSALLSLRGV
jgi:hypothetical protein